MTTPTIIVLSLVSLVLLTSLVAFGIGHRRWSWVSVVGSFLVVFALGGYVYLAARLLDFEWKWVQVVRTTQLKIHEVRDALRPSSDPEQPVRLERIPDVRSIAELRLERDRWERAAERVDNWRGRHWTQASFRPPTADGQPGTIELPPATAAGGEARGAEPGDPAAGGDGEAGEPDGSAPRSPGVPIDPGATLYVFDDRPAKEGGLYLGAFLVQAVAADPGTGRLAVTVEQTAPADEYDRAAWSRGYDAVTVYDELPFDRWLAFSKVPPGGATSSVEEQIAPRPAKKSGEDLADLPVPEPFLDAVERHALTARDAVDKETVDEADWPALREALASGEKLPGEAWAEVVFRGQVDLDAFLGLDRDSIEEDDDSLSAEVELGKAFELVDEQKATIRKVFRRRRLIDAATIVHGSVVPGGEAAGGDVMADGVATLMRILQQDIVVLDTANERLVQSQKNVAAEQSIVSEQAAQLTADLVKWQRDLTAATKLADAFEAESKRAAARLEAAEESVVRLGRELDETVGAAVRRIDQVAPAAGRGAAVPAATF